MGEDHEGILGTLDGGVSARPFLFHTYTMQHDIISDIIYTMNTNKGFIQIVVLIVIILIVLGYFGLNIRDIIDSPAVSDNLSYAWGVVVHVWQNYLAAPVAYLFGVFKNLLWGAFITNLESIKNGSGNTLENMAPSVGTTTP